MEQLVCLLLANPASSAEAERSFSGLRRLETFILSDTLYDPYRSILITVQFRASISISWMR
jgi:hypothetical protein